MVHTLPLWPWLWVSKNWADSSNFFLCTHLTSPFITSRSLIWGLRNWANCPLLSRAPSKFCSSIFQYFQGGPINPKNKYGLGFTIAILSFRPILFFQRTKKKPDSIFIYALFATSAYLLYPDPCETEIQCSSWSAWRRDNCLFIQQSTILESNLSEHS